MDEKKREAMIQQAAETAMNDTALIPIHYEVSTWATAKGYKYTPRTDQYTLATDLKPVIRLAGSAPAKAALQRPCSPSPSAASARASSCWW
jgi:hypothetical protein